jgi:4-amino-4-deoxy-L-arabinose transferase-like glycosyltransferase
MTKFTLTKPTIKWLVLLLTLIGFGLRMKALGSESLWYDELLQASIGAETSLSDLLFRLRVHAALPLDYLITHYWLYIATPNVLQRIPSDFWMRLPAVMMGTLTLPLAFQLGRSLLNTGYGLLLMVLFIISPFHLHYSQELRPYALGLMGVSLFSCLLWRMRTTGPWHYLPPLIGAGIILSMSHYFANVIFLPWGLFLGLDFLVAQERTKRLRVLVAVAIVGLVVAGLLTWLGWANSLLNISGQFAQTLAEPEQFAAAPAEKPDQGTGPLLNAQFFRVSVLGPLGAGANTASLVLVNGLVLLGLASLISQKKYRVSLLLALWVIVPVATILAFLVHRGTFFAPRYIIFILPAYLLLLAAGLLAIPHWLHRRGWVWAASLVFLIVGGSLWADLGTSVARYYQDKDKEDWHLVAQFIANNAQPDDAIIPVRAEPVLGWYMPQARVAGNTYDDLSVIEVQVAQAKRSWVVLSIFSSGIDSKIKAWLSDGEQGAVRFVLDPVITVYYLGHNTDKETLLTEIRNFALPVNHSLYASLARENRRHPEIARRYWELAVAHAPNDIVRAEYQQALDELE